LFFTSAAAILELPGAPSFFAPNSEEPVAGTKVTVFNNGPLRIEGDFELVDQEGKSFGLGGRTSITLCRCGLSLNEPFCDATHKRQNFVSTIAARDLPAVPKA
jgi:CDGSH-type Zn-finger protein